MKIEKEVINKIHAVINPYIMRYCESKYRPQVRQLVSIFIDNIPDNITISKEIIVNSPHTLAYDYQPFIGSSLAKILKGKQHPYVDGFYQNLLKMIRGGYLDGIQNGDLDREKKIMAGTFFINLIENLSLIEGVDVDTYFKLKERVKQETERLELASPDTMVLDYYYWKYPLVYLKKFEELMLRDGYIEKHADFESMFKSYSIISQEGNMIQFKGSRPELWYMLFRVYKNKLNFMGMGLHKIAGDLFIFIGKKNNFNVTNSSWAKFQSQIEDNVRTKDYIRKMLSKAHQLIEELNLPQQ